MTAPLPIYLLDPGHRAWLIGVTDAGDPTTTYTAQPTTTAVNSVLLRDYGGDGIWWALGVDTDGDFTWTRTSSTTARTVIALQAPGGVLWGIRIFDGDLQITTPPCQNDWQPGVQYSPTWNGVQWSQPGGPGTIVLPQQQNGPFVNYPVPGNWFIELSGLWTVGCGHWVDFPLILQDYDCLTATSIALACCPLCSYVQYVISPYAQAVNADPQFGVPVVII